MISIWATLMTRTRLSTINKCLKISKDTNRNTVKEFWNTWNRKTQKNKIAYFQPGPRIVYNITNCKKYQVPHFCILCAQLNLAVTLTFPLNLALKSIIYDEILATAMGEKDAQVQYDLTFLNPPIMSPSCPMLWYKVSHGHQVFSIVYFVILSLPSDQGEWVCYYCLHTNVSSGNVC